jgi:hypothetical protein
LEGSGQQWLDDFVTESQQSRQNLESLWKWLVALLAGQALDHLFARNFFRS